MDLKPILKTAANSGALALTASLLLPGNPAAADTVYTQKTIAFVPAPVTDPVAATQPAGEPIIEEMDFKDIKVSELLSILAKNFKVKVIVSNDAREVTLASITLNDMTPTAAVEYVAEAAGLQFRKKPDGTYLVAKALGDDPAARTVAPATAGLPAIAPSTLGMGAAQSAAGAGILPANTGNVPAVAFGGNGNSAPSLANLDLPTLEPTSTSSRGGRARFRVRNISPSIIAYWLDPENNPEPIQFLRARGMNGVYAKKNLADLALSREDTAAISGQATATPVAGFSPTLINPYVQSRSSGQMRPSVLADPQFNRGGVGGNRGGARGGAGGGVFQLPTGVSRIVAIDPQNALLVEFTDVAGLQELQDTIAFLDRPLRQVEIEAQFVTVSTGDSRSFGIDFSTSRGNFNVNNVGFAPEVSATAPGLSVGFVRGNFQAQLNTLINTNRAKVITAPRVTAINNLTASLQSTTSTPLILSSSSSGIGGQVGQSQNLIYITTAIGLTVTPTINNDDTVTVLMQPQFSSQNPSGVPGVSAPAISQQTLETIANVRDGETIALGGLKTQTISRGGSKIPLVGDLPLVGKFFKSRNATDQESELIIFLTARILRRFGDDENPAGT